MNSTIKLDKDIIQKYKLLIYKIANKIYKRDDGIEYDDLLQAGFEVLLKAYPQYNKDKGSIINYLTIVITRSIREEYNLQKNIISIPRGVMDYANHYYIAKRLYNDDKEILNYLINNTVLTKHRAKTLINHKALAQPIILDDTYLTNYLIDSNNLDNELDTKKLIKLIISQFKYLDKRERYIIYRKYLFEEDIKLRTIAKELNMSEQQCNAIHKRALSKLRNRLSSKLKRKED